MANEVRAMLELIVPRLVNAIMESMGVDDKEALIVLYSSKLYAQLEKDETKLWHLSVPTLLELLREELETGQITYPEEA